jgi:hypothetical protein
MNVVLDQKSCFKWTSANVNWDQYSLWTGFFDIAAKYDICLCSNKFSEKGTFSEYLPDIVST